MWFNKSWFSDTHLNIGSKGFVLVVERANGQEGKNLFYTFVFFSVWQMLPLKTFPENAAFWGETTQSSEYFGCHSGLAVDGLVDTFTHTNTETNPWWRVDLLKVYSVNRVTIINRNTFPSRIDGAVIHVGIFPDIYSNTMW